jgi:hypothetical protein
MTTDATPIDISNIPDLVRIAEEAKQTGKSYLLRESSQDIAILSPIKQHKPNQQAIEDTLALAGSWSDLDWDDMMQELDRIRHESKPTPPIDLDV